MPANDVPGVGEILAWAQFLNIDVGPTLEKLAQLLETDPTAIWGGSDQLGGLAGDLLGTEQGDLNQVGTDTGAGMSGLTADAFSKFSAGLVGQVAGAGEAAQQLAGKLGQLATSFAESQDVVISLTGATATALGMLRT